MENKEQKITPILEVAWRKFAQYDRTSVIRTASYTRLRQWIAVTGVLATLFAILYNAYHTQLPQIAALTLQILLVSAPIIASVLAAFTNKFFSTGDWLIARAGAEGTR